MLAKITWAGLILAIVLTWMDDKNSVVWWTSMGMLAASCTWLARKTT